MTENRTAVEGFFNRVREHAWKLDRHEPLVFERTISFDDAADMVALVTPRRIRIIRHVRLKPITIPELARRLSREEAAVKHDTEELIKAGLLESTVSVERGRKQRTVCCRTANFRVIAEF